MTIDASAVLDAVRGVLAGTLGSVRTVGSTELDETSHGQTSDGERWIRATGTVQADVQITGGPWQTTAIGPSTASAGVWVLGLTVELSYSISPYADLTPARRYTARQEAIEDVEKITLALCWPNNVAVDASANATGLISGRLSRQGIDGQPLPPAVWTERADDGVGLLVVKLPFEAWIRSTAAVA